MRVILGTFARFCLEQRFGRDPALGIDPALRYYEHALDSEAPPPDVPRFLPSLAPVAGGGLELEIGPEFEPLLEREAERQAVPVDELVTHLVFAYVAHLEAAA